MKYYTPTKESLRIGDTVEMRQCKVSYIKDENKNIVDTIPWDGNINESNEDNYWVNLSITQGDLDGEHCRSFGHNDHFNIFMFPLRKQIEQ